MTETFDFDLHNRLYEGGHSAELIKWDLEMKKNPVIGINGLNGNTFFEIEPTSQVKSYELESLLLNGKAKIIDINEAENTLREEFKKDSDFIMENEKSYSEKIIQNESRLYSNNQNVSEIPEGKENPRDTNSLHRINELTVRTTYLFRQEYDLERRLSRMKNADNKTEFFLAATNNLPEFASNYFAVEILPHPTLSQIPSYMIYKTDKKTTKFPVHTYVKNNLLLGSMEGLKNLLPEHLQHEEMMVDDFNITALPMRKDYVNTYELVNPKMLNVGNMYRNN